MFRKCFEIVLWIALKCSAGRCDQTTPQANATTRRRACKFYTAVFGASQVQVLVEVGSISESEASCAGRRFLSFHRSVLKSGSSNPPPYPFCSDASLIPIKGRYTRSSFEIRKKNYMFWICSTHAGSKESQKRKSSSLWEKNFI
jgi:hypothetical protein